MLQTAFAYYIAAVGRRQSVGERCDSYVSKWLVLAEDGDIFYQYIRVMVKINQLDLMYLSAQICLCIERRNENHPMLRNNYLYYIADVVYT